MDCVNILYVVIYLILNIALTSNSLTNTILRITSQGVFNYNHYYPANVQRKLEQI